MLVHSNLSADTPDPVSIALRSRMKGQFLSALSKQDLRMPEWEEASLVVYGSTLMRQLVLTENIDFPLSGLKSSDIDIGVTLGTNTVNDYREQLEEHAVPLIRQAVIDTGFDLIRHGKHLPEAVHHSDQIGELPDGAFLGDFYVAQTFSPEEMHAILGEKKNYERLKPLIPTQPLRVLLVLGVNDKPFPCLLDPVETTSADGEGTFLRTMAIDMMAGKIVRCMTDKYKPTDLIDIYNLFHGRCRDTGQNWLKFDSDNPENHIDALRALVVAYLPMSRGISPTRSTLLGPLNNTAHNKTRFLEMVRDQVDSTRFDELAEHVNTIYSTLDVIMATVFGPRSMNPHGPLNLTDAEMAFCDAIDGRYAETRLVTPERRELRFLSVTFRQHAPAQYETTYQYGQPKLDATPLADSYPAVFARYPELRDRITHNPILQAKVHENIVNRARDVSLDF